jgi:hypothetical protein
MPATPLTDRHEIARGTVKAADPEQLVDVTATDAAWLPAIARLPDPQTRCVLRAIHGRAAPADGTRTLTMLVRHLARLQVANPRLRVLTHYRPEPARPPRGARVAPEIDRLF